MQPVSPCSRGPASGDVHVCRGEVLAALAAVLDWRPEPAVPHHGRVAALAARMASRLNRVDRIDAFYAGLLHDIGLAALGTRGEETEAGEDQPNRPTIRSHPLTGAQMVATVPELLTVAEIILDHHECANGHGYPRGKSGQEITPAAQAIRFAETCDLLLREQGSPELIPFLDALRSRTASQTTPQVADAGIEVLGEPGFYAQLLAADDVEFLVRCKVERLTGADLTTTEAEVTSMLELFAAVADSHPSDKIGHSRRVANLAVLVAMAMGLSPAETAKLRWAALVHDVGTMTVPKNLLDKPGPLGQDELAAIRRHVLRPAEFLGRVRGLEEVVTIATAHAEAFDGSGYPRGLAGRQIPLGSRILAVCNAFDALTSRRPYREARSVSLAIDILHRGSGSLFDPDVVEAAVPVILISQRAHEPAMQA